jgi:hypothetical protein
VGGGAVPFSAMLDGQRVDLFGEDADDVWARAKVAKLEGRLRCKGCDGELRLRAPMNKSRHFFHLRKADHCPLSGAPESEAHGRAKRAVAAAIRETGGTAEIEWVSPGRTFVADVLAEWADGSENVLRVVFEVQVSSQTRDRTFERDAVREAAADRTVWVLMAGPGEDGEVLPAAGWARWSNEVSSILLADDNDLAGWWASHLEGTGPLWRSTSLASLVAAIGCGAVFLSADHPWERGGWVSTELWQRRQHEAEKRRQQEESVRRARELHEQNRAAFSARASSDLAALLARLRERGHKPRVHPGGAMYGHAVLVTAGDRRFAVMPAANQVWSHACRSKLATTTVIASDARDQRRLGAVQVAAVAVSEVPISQAPSATDSAELPSGVGLSDPKLAVAPPGRGGDPGHGAQASALTRKERRLQRAADEDERARAAAIRRADADLKRREAHLLRTARRIGYSVGQVDIEEGWVVAEVEGRTVLTGPLSSSPPEGRRTDSVVWSDSPHQAARLEADGWATIATLSSLRPSSGPPSPGLTMS